MIFNVSNGATLNYRIKGVTAAPTEPGSANDIVIVTEAAIGDVQINCMAEPTLRSDGTAPQTGDVYILTKTNSVGAFNALKQNALYGLPGACYQYGGEAWNAVYAYIFQDDAWKCFSTPFTLEALSYSGVEGVDYEKIDDGEGNWRMRLLTSGTLTVSSSGEIDVFLVGGGGGGGSVTADQTIGAGGGGGRTTTALDVSVTPGNYTIVIGAGGARGKNGTNSGKGGAGGQTSAFEQTANGGSAQSASNKGGNGGSGGGGAQNVGGSDGGNGSGETGYVGIGQGTTTREFGEGGATLYAGGGGGGSNTGTGKAGGAGGGARGGATGSAPTATGVANTGGGGGGGGYSLSYNGCPSGSAGGCGIVIIRNHREAAA